MRFAPPATLVDAALLVAVTAVVVSGFVSLVSGEPGEAWIFAAHAIVGLLLVVLVILKVWRVLPRLRQPSTWDREVAVSLFTLGLVSAALLTGIAWSSGGRFGFWLWTGLSVHVFFGLLLIPIFLLHLSHRFHLPDRADFEGRRTAIQFGLMVIGGTLVWRAQQSLTALLGVGDRFTGSRIAGEAPGNTFPVTMWVADDPDPIDPQDWELRIEGTVSTPSTYRVPDLHESDSERATLDCTSGWYTEQEWAGVRVSRLLEEVQPTPEAKWISFHSVTGYRWSLPIDEAHDALLATHVSDEPLTHGHGAPLRLVAPGRRGFQWVKWVERVEVRPDPDYGQWIAIFTSGFS